MRRVLAGRRVGRVVVALLIAVITWFGLVTFMLGLVVAFPWLAHASWHAYRGLVEQEPPGA